MRALALFTILFFSLSLSAQMRQLQVESNHSTIGFSISIAGFTKVTGKFADYQILLDWDAEEVAASSIEAEIQAASINTGIAARDEHLRTADFFNVEEYPTITFRSDSIQRINYAHYQAFGQLSMHGVTQAIVLPFEIVKVDGNTIGFKARTTINRLDYGVGKDFVHTSMPDFLSEDIEVEIDFWTKRRKE